MAAEFSIVELSIDGKTVEFEVPTSLFEAAFEHDEMQRYFKLYSYTAQHVALLLRMLLPKEQRLPTPSQLEYATKIATGLGIEIPIDSQQNSGACSDFIEKHKDDFYVKNREEKNREREFRQKRNAFAAKAINVSRWLQAQMLLDAGEAIENVAVQLNVKPPTIKKYCEHLLGWEAEDKETKEHQLVLLLLADQKSGIHPYEAVKVYITEQGIQQVQNRD